MQQLLTSLAGGLQEVADANARLSLLGIAVGKKVKQLDNSTVYQYNGDAEAVQIIGAGTEAANGYYTKRGTVNGKGYFNLIGYVTNVDHAAISWTGSDWKIFDADHSPIFNSTDDVAFPWLVTTWNDVGGGTVPTTSHITSKNALLTCAFVSGAGTTAANGIYTERPGLGEPGSPGRKVYNLLGQPDSLTNYAIIPGVSAPYWTITDSSGTILYVSGAFDNVQYPWQATFMEILGNSPAPTVVSKTQGELDAGVLVTGAMTSGANDVYPVTGVTTKNKYTGIAHASLLQYLDDHSSFAWRFAGTDPQSTDDTAFPWEATFNDSAVVTQNPIASESNWEPLSP